MTGEDSHGVPISGPWTPSTGETQKPLEAPGRAGLNTDLFSGQALRGGRWAKKAGPCRAELSGREDGVAFLRLAGGSRVRVHTHILSTLQTETTLSTNPTFSFSLRDAPSPLPQPTSSRSQVWAGCVGRGSAGGSGSRWGWDRAFRSGTREEEGLDNKSLPQGPLETPRFEAGAENSGNPREVRPSALSGAWDASVQLPLQNLQRPFLLCLRPVAGSAGLRVSYKQPHTSDKGPPAEGVSVISKATGGL